MIRPDTFNGNLVNGYFPTSDDIAAWSVVKTRPNKYAPFSGGRELPYEEYTGMCQV